jgi:hypothetical protein
LLFDVIGSNFELLVLLLYVIYSDLLRLFVAINIK